MSGVLTSPSRLFTYADLESLPDDGYRREVIGGSLVVTPAPNGGHQLAIAKLVIILEVSRPADVLVIPSPYDWRHPDGGIVQPDLVVIRRSDFDARGPLGAAAVPLLVVEVLSPSNPELDRSLKRALYERLGVPSYWLVDPIAPSIVALDLVGGHYQQHAATTGQQAFAASTPFPVAFSPSDLQA